MQWTKTYPKNTKSPEELLEWLYSLQRFGIKPGLERTYALLEACGNPHHKLRTIHVAGTNGKGSVCSMLASVLTSAGYKTGLYTSPHIVDFNERIRINGLKISNNELVEYCEILLPHSNKIGCTFFEITTAMAFLHFARNDTDFAVIETGMGGRFDSTNVLNPLISIITSISLDHSEYLGDTLESIALEKAGIIKKNVPVVSPEKNPDIINIFRQKANEKGTILHLIDDDFTCNINKWNPDLTMDCDVQTINEHYQDIHLPLAGEHQKNNLLTAIHCLELLTSKIEIPSKSIYQGLKDLRKNTGITARIELLREEPPLVTDVAHNPDAIGKLVDTIRKCGYTNKWDIVFASMSDKDYGSSLEILSTICSTVYLTDLKIQRAATSEEIEQKAIESGIQDVKCFKNSKDAFGSAIKNGRPLIVVGSFYLIGELWDELKMFKDK